ncbi:D-arabinono-1,4-lactone oxidase [Aureispira anguillae]|uniref:FAD-binding protein n=1 Tax=Aureispira anguillae TaxID=2864201 RepID=A0A915YHK7_9BACT|nr:D-arabinono-1,4-lactone oxidase [Aureispira anguillae]BDS13144.1 FAD-binding protein [Aureispira anguillae]
MIEALIKSAGNKGTQWSNWSENVTCLANRIFYPRTEAEIIEIIHLAKAEQKKIRVVGEGHSFSPLVETDHFIVSLKYMAGVISVDKANLEATVWAGTSINKTNAELYKQGFAMINLGDIDVQSLAGATATGTHGTGTAFGNVSTEIVAFTLITAEGKVLTCSKEENVDLFVAGRVSLGALGIITQMTFKIMKAYKLEYVSSAGDFYETLEQLEDYNSKNRNFEFYYFPYSNIVQLKESNITEQPVKNNKVLAYINDVFLENTIMNLICKVGTAFPSTFKRLCRGMAKVVPKGKTIDYSHKIYATVRNVYFKEMEYNIPIEHFKDCIQQFKKMVEENEYYVFFPVECRFVKGDDIWLSPAYGRDSAYIAVHVYAKTPHNPYFKEVEELFMQYDGRPHWGKMHTRTAANLARTYPKWEDFLTLRKKMDPQGLFLNPHLENIFGLV